MSRSTRGLVLLGVMVAALVVGAAPIATASCHFFQVSAQPSTVAEGGSVTVTVSRDGAVAPSRVDVESVDGTATRGADYAQVARRTISFTNETEQSFNVSTIDNADPEPSETFRLHLSNPAGCSGSGLAVGSDAVATITDTDQTPTTPPPTTAPPTTVPRTTTTAAPGSSTTTTATDDSTTTSLVESSSSSSASSTSTTDESTTTTEDEAEVELASDQGDDGGGGRLLIVIAVVVLGALGAGGWWLARRRGAEG